jgi:hypothetical protein
VLRNIPVGLAASPFAAAPLPTDALAPGAVDFPRQAKPLNRTDLFPRLGETTLDVVFRLFLCWGMILLLRKQRAQSQVKGREPFDWPDDDYAIVDETKVGVVSADVPDCRNAHAQFRS